MEHQFFYDLMGQPAATCPIECEAFGDWLTHDLAQNHKQITLLLEIVHQLMTQQIHSYQHNSTDYHLIFDKDEVELIANNHPSQTLAITEQPPSPADTSGCGLVDFQQLLTAWQRFIR